MEYYSCNTEQRRGAMEQQDRNCPYCGGGLEVERLRCSSCDIVIEGRIPIPRLARLAPDHRRFIELFVRCSGSLKAVAEQLGVSYPTVRNRLNRVIDALESEEIAERDSRRKILDAVESGAMSVDEAVERLREV